MICTHYNIQVSFANAKNPMFNTKDVYRALGKPTRPKDEMMSLGNLLQLVSKKNIYTDFRKQLVKDFGAWLAPKETAHRLVGIVKEEEKAVVLDENDIEAYILVNVQRGREVACTNHNKKVAKISFRCSCGYAFCKERSDSCSVPHLECPQCGSKEGL